MWAIGRMENGKVIELLRQRYADGNEAKRQAGHYRRKHGKGSAKAIDLDSRSYTVGKEK